MTKARFKQVYRDARVYQGMVPGPFSEAKAIGISCYQNRELRPKLTVMTIDKTLKQLLDK